MTEHITVSRELLRKVLEGIERSRCTAMIQTLVARIPESGLFAGIAQDLDFAESNLRAVLEQPEVEPVQTLIAKLQADPDYAWSWHCNIAMAYVDAGGDPCTGNQGAARFMKMFANVDPAHELPAPPPADAPLLTETEIEAIESRECPSNGPMSTLNFARSIEQAVRQKAGLK